MTRYLTNYKAELAEHEYYVCPSCGEETEHYHHLYHPNNETGGFCPYCKGDVDEHTHYTVYTKVYASSAEQAVEFAYEYGDFQVMEGSIILKEKIK